MGEREENTQNQMQNNLSFPEAGKQYKHTEVKPMQVL